MNESGMGGWIIGFIIILIVLGMGNGGGLFGNNNAALAGFATATDVNNAINAAFANQNSQNILLSSANNNYETAQLINAQSMAAMNQSNTNLVNAIQGFNNVTQSIAAVNQNIANLGFKMEECCCGIKTMLLENRLQDTQIALQNQQNIAVNAEQSQYLLSQMGKWTPYAAAAAYAAK